jgi:hypothetical protein
MKRVFFSLSQHANYKNIFSIIVVVIAAAISPTGPSNAQEEIFESQTVQQPTTMNSASDATGKKRMNRGCPISNNSKSNHGDDGKFINKCVSTSNIKQLDTYSPPWTFQDQSKHLHVSKEL